MRIIVLLILSLTLTSCSSQFAYRHLDWVILWYSDDYLELNDHQELIFTEHLEATLSWHQFTELPKYKNQLLELNQHLDDLPLSIDMLQYHYNLVQHHWQVVRYYLSAKLTPLVNQLSYEQKQYLFTQLEERNKSRLEAHLERTHKEHKNIRNKRWEETLEEAIGSLNSVQKKILDAHLDQHHDLTQLRIEYLQRYQNQLKQVMTSPTNEAELNELLNSPERFKTKQHKALKQQNRQNTLAMLNAISVHLTPKQIKALRNKIDEYVEAIEELTEMETQT